MKRRFLLLLTASLFCFLSKGQHSPAEAGQVVTWSFEAKKIADNVYEVRLIAIIKNPWHIYSQTTPEGGPLPTKIQFSKNPLFSVEGGMKEVGKMQTKHEEVFGVDVKYFNDKVEFVQILRYAQNDKRKIKTMATGSIEYMVCNDTQCLPPKIVSFNVKLN